MDGKWASLRVANRMTDEALAWKSEELSIKYCRRKTIGIYVSAEKGVEVRVPHFVSRQEALNFVDSKQDWIHKQLLNIAERPVRFEPSYQWGEVFYFLGEKQRFHHQALDAVDLVLWRGTLPHVKKKIFLLPFTPEGSRLFMLVL